MNALRESGGFSFGLDFSIERCYTIRHMNKMIKNLVGTSTLLGILFFATGIHAAFSPSILSATALPETKNPTSINVTSFINTNGSDVTAWFEYGTSVDLVNHYETEHVFKLTNDSTVTFNQTISNLTPNVTYFFRAVVNNGQNTAKGQTFWSRIEAPEENINVSTTNTNQNSVSNNTDKITNTDYTYDNAKLAATALFALDFKSYAIFNYIALIILIVVLLILFRKLRMDYTYYNNKKQTNHSTITTQTEEESTKTESH